ncbi:beta-lactamase/transpeptidase-like protein [Agrocybe pediades]|nr:beta-lactamase/transpeptidase-like protein [Agrocybe pediades]
MPPLSAHMPQANFVEKQPINDEEQARLAGIRYDRGTDTRDATLANERATRFSRAQRLHLVIVAVILLILGLDYCNSNPDLFSPITSFSFADLLPESSTSVATWPWDKPACRPPSINLFAAHPPRPNLDPIVKASNDLDKFLSQSVSKNGVDSLAVAVVTPAGPIFLKGYGVLRANETSSEPGDSEDPENPDPPAPEVDGDTIYRLASISKMFTVLETLVLRERGVLNWDDPVDKYLPDFSPPSYGWAEYLDGTQGREAKPRITLRQLASHLSGIGRDLPQADFGEWPVDDPVAHMPDLNQTELDRTYETIIKATSKYPLITAPYNYPVYSNTGFELLGLANVAANLAGAKDASKEPQTHKELLKRDIFDPLKLKSSFFRLPASEELRGNLPGYHSEFAIVPELSVGFILLSTGYQVDTTRILSEIGKHFVSAFDKVHEAEVRKKFVGKWESGEDVAEVEMDKGILYLKKMVVRNVDVLLSVQRYLGDVAAVKSVGSDNKEMRVNKRDGPYRVMLWPTGRQGEFRLAFGRPALNSQKDLGCFPYWVSIDPPVLSRGAPYDLVYWKSGVLQYPSAGVSFSRQR